MKLEERLTEKEARIMFKVFSWAYNNGISVELSPRHEYGGNVWPEITFRKNENSIKKSIYLLTDIGKHLDCYWKQIALELCVAPLDLSEFLK